MDEEILIQKYKKTFIKGLTQGVAFGIGYVNGVKNIQISTKNFDKEGCPIVYDRVLNSTIEFKNNELQNYLNGIKRKDLEYIYVCEQLKPKIDALISETAYLYGRCTSKDWDNRVLSLERSYRLRDFLREWNSTLETMSNIIQQSNYIPLVFGLENTKCSKKIIKNIGLDKKPLSRFRDCSDKYCPEMIVIPNGEFIMGGTDEEHVDLGVNPMVYPWDQPRHKVTIKKSFAIGKYEVTIGQYKQFLKETGYVVPEGATTVVRVENPKTKEMDTRVTFTDGLTFDKPGEGFTGLNDDFPMVAVRREDAREFAKWLSIKTNQTYRLPYEAEWEYAARANTGYHYYIWGNTTKGDEPCKYANLFDMDSFDKFKFKFEHFECRDGAISSTKVGSYLPNQFGIHDMIANAREWVDDCWHYGFENAPSDGSRWGEENNGLCSFGVLRGGSFYYNTFNVRIAYRNAYFSSQSRSVMWGFRLVREI